MNNYLIFIKDTKKGIIPEIAKSMKFVNFKVIYKELFNENKLYCKLINKLHLPLIKGFFDGWKKEKNLEIETIILFDSGYNYYVIKTLKRCYPNSKIILYFWNSINNYNIDFLKSRDIYRIFTFDKNDAKKYDIKYNPQFYTKNIKINESNIKNDMLFIGRAKKRKEYILNLKSVFEENGLKPNIIIVEKEDDFILYKNYLKKLEESKTILDIIDEGQIGLTIRCMESLFFKKKLITNNKDIVNYKFYKPNNVFILGVDDMNKIKGFINSPYEEVDEKIVNYYDFESWLERFKENRDEY